MGMFKSLAEAEKNPADCAVLKLTIKGSTLPEGLFKLAQLQELYLEAPLIKTLPDFSAFPKLRLLSIKAPSLESGIAALFLLPNLQNLKVLDTPLDPFTMKLEKKMAPLSSLSLKSCGIKKLPLELGELTLLQELGLQDNELAELPFTFPGLINLKRLNLDANRFTTFPDLVGELNKLQHISIDSNQFSESERARIQRQFNITPA